MPKKAESRQVREGRLVPTYPVDPRSLPHFYSNHISISITPEELYLDVCIVQPQATSAVVGAESQIAAQVVSRIILTRAHAKRLADAINRVIQKD